MPINESLNLSVLFGGSVKATASTTIVDTSIPAYEYILVPSNPSSTAITEIDVPTYTLTANKSSINEGDSVVFTLTTTMLDTGTIVPYTISGVSVSDISLSSLTGNFTTDAAGKATLTLSLIEDVLTEGTEILTISINGQSASRSVTINDTSGQPSYNIGWYSDAAGNNAITHVNEGATAYAVIKTTNVPNGTLLHWSLAGYAGPIDYSNAETGTVTINNNIGYMTLSPKADLLTEGNETVDIIFYRDGNMLGRKTITINDTSTAPYDGGEVIFTMAKTPTYGIPVTNTRSYSVYVNTPPYTMPSPIGTFHSDTLTLNGIPAQIDSISVYSIVAGYGDWFVHIDVRGQGNVGNVGDRNIVVTRVDNGVVLANSRLTNEGGGGVRFTSTPVGQSRDFTLPVGVKLKLTIVKV